jgi:putative aldouronate transport system substrate-binding protein
VNNAINGNLVALDDLLPTVTPKLWEMVPETAWNMSRVNGKIFAIPNQQLWYEAWGIILDKEIADKYSIDLNTINKYEDFNPYLQKVLEGEPQLAKKLIGEMDGGTFHPLTWGYESVISAGVIKLGDMSRQIVNWYETPEFRQAVDQAWKWHEAG